MMSLSVFYSDEKRLCLFLFQEHMKGMFMNSISMNLSQNRSNANGKSPSVELCILPVGLMPCARYLIQYNNIRHFAVVRENAFLDTKL
jgi:hypothetical protein